MQTVYTGSVQFGGHTCKTIHVSPQITPYRGKAFVRLGAILRKLPMITREAEDRMEKDGGSFLDHFHEQFDKNKGIVQFRKRAPETLRLFDTHGVRTYFLTKLPSEKFVLPVIDWMKAAAPENEAIQQITTKNFIFSGHTTEIHRAYNEVTRKILATAHGTDGQIPVIGLLVGYEHADVCLATQVNQTLISTRSNSVVIPLIHAGERFRVDPTAPPVQISRKTLPLKPLELIAQAGCIPSEKGRAPMPRSTPIASRDLDVLGLAGLKIFQTFITTKITPSCACN